MTSRKSALVGLLIAACVLVGCGGTDPSSSVFKGNARFTAAGTPRPVERFADALRAIERASRAKDCNGVRNRLSSVWKPIKRSFCRNFKQQLGVLTDPRAKVYGTAAAVYHTGPAGEPRVLLLGLDLGGRWKMVYTMAAGAQTSGRPIRRYRDRLARHTVQALRMGNCDAFLSVAHRTIGLGSGDPSEACARLRRLPLAVDLRANPDLEPVSLGGNREFAFYAIRVPHPRRYYTLVFARRQRGPQRPRHATLAFSVFLPAD